MVSITSSTGVNSGRQDCAYFFAVFLSHIAFSFSISGFGKDRWLLMLSSEAKLHLCASEMCDCAGEVK